MKFWLTASFGLAVVLASLSTPASAAIVADTYAAFTPNQTSGSVDFGPWRSNMLDAVLSGSVSNAGPGWNTHSQDRTQFADVNGTGGWDVRNVIVTNSSSYGQFSDFGSRASFLGVLQDDAGGKVTIGSTGVQPIIRRTNHWSAIGVDSTSSYNLVIGLDWNGSAWEEVFTGTANQELGAADRVVFYSSYGFGASSQAEYDQLYQNLLDPNFQQDPSQWPGWTNGALLGTTANFYLTLADFQSGNAFASAAVAYAAVPEPSTLVLFGIAGLGLLAYRRFRRQQPA